MLTDPELDSPSIQLTRVTGSSPLWPVTAGHRPCLTPKRTRSGAPAPGQRGSAVALIGSLEHMLSVDEFASGSQPGEALR